MSEFAAPEAETAPVAERLASEVAPAAEPAAVEVAQAAEPAAVEVAPAAEPAAVEVAPGVFVTLRPARDEDLPVLWAYCYSEGMDNIPSVDDVTVAADADDDPVGFIRLAFSGEGVAHVNPVVVNPLWRGYGVGRLLTEGALTQHGELRLVSRGSSIPFYRALGFVDISWEDIAPGVTDDCSSCELRAECGPQPMKKVL